MAASAPLVELVRLLSADALEGEELQVIVDAVATARDNPDLAFLKELDADDGLYTGIALRFELHEFCAASDKIDELYEQLADQFDPPLTAFDEALWNAPLDDAFAWIDGLLAERGADVGGYRLLLLETGLDDEVVAFAVKRGDADRILAVATSLGVRMSTAVADAEVA